MTLENSLEDCILELHIMTPGLWRCRACLPSRAEWDRGRWRRFDWWTGGHSHTQTGQDTRFHFPRIAKKISHVLTRKFPARAREAVIQEIALAPAWYGRAWECTGCCLQMGGRAQASHCLWWEGGAASVTKITLCFRIVRCNCCGGRSGPEEHSSFCTIQVQCQNDSIYWMIFSEENRK